MVNAAVREERARFVSGSANRVYGSEAKITGDRYTSPEFMALEMDRLWPRVWNIGGWANEIPEAGDFVTHALGRESILMVRQRDGSVRAFHNVCPHRGNRLVYVDSGSLERFTCTYHGWTFDHGGSLIHVQDADDFPQGNPCGKLTLSEIPCEVWAGFIWYNMDQDCAPLGDFMGELKTYFDRHNMSAAKRVYYKVCEVNFNWKALHDNFCESYHLPTTHPQINDYYDDDYKNTDFELFETGHNLMKMKGSLPSLRGDEPFAMNAKLEGDLQTWGLDSADFAGRAHAVRHALQAQKRRLGAAKGFMHFKNLPDAWLTDAFHFNVFPGTSITILAEVFSLQRCEPHATDPNKCIYEHWHMALKPNDADLVPGPEGMVPCEEVEKRVVIYGEETLSDVADQDLERATGQQLGFQSRGFKGAYLSGQENRVQQFHNFIDRYIYSHLRPRVSGELGRATQGIEAMKGRSTFSRSAFAPSLLAAALTVGIASSAVAAEIEEILVTARAVDESVRDVPVAISAFNEEQLQRFAIRDLEDLAASSASLEIGRIASGNGAQIAIRGISSSPGSLGIEQSVALILDGVYFPQGRTINEGLFDARQVAILKGPQALYFGKNASAGAVVVTTNDPGSEREAHGRLSYEIETKTISGEAVFSTPLNDRWGVRLAFQGTGMSDGYLKNVAGPTTYTTFDAAAGFTPTAHENGPAADSWIPGEETLSGRITLKGQLNDTTTLKLKGTYTDFKYNSVNLSELYDCPTLGGTPHANTADPDNPGLQKAIPNLAGGECRQDRSRGLNPIPPTVAATTKDLNQFGGDPGEAYESYIFTADLETNLENFLIRNILNYHSQDVGWVIDADGGASTSIFASEFNQFENFSFESRTATAFDSAVNGVLGFYYQTTDRKFRQEVIFAGAENSAADPTNRFIAYDKVSGTDGETVSGYGEVIWDITDELQLTGGARYIWENKDSEFTQPYVNPAFGALFIQDRVLASDKSYDDVVAELTVRYQPTDNITYYAAYKQGWKSGGFDNGSIDSTLNSDPIGDITYEPEEVDGVEGGVKGVFLDGALSVDFDVYHYQFKNLQLNFFNATTFAYRTLNAGVAETTGGEVQVNWATEIEGLTLSAAIAYNDASYKEFLAPCYGGQSFADGCNIGTGALKDQDLSGEPRGLAPKWRGNLGFNYRHPVGGGLELGLAGNLKFADDYTLSEYITNAVQDGYALLDASVRIGSDDGRWTVAVIGRNLTDEYILTSAADAPSTGGNTGTDRAFQSDRYAFFKLPRTIALELSMRL